MERKIILASHHLLADGLKDTLQFIGGDAANEISVITAYIDDHPINDVVHDLMTSVNDEVELVVLTDMKAGSVNQSFIKYTARPHTHIISGMNLPLALGFLLEPSREYLTKQRIEQLITQAQTEIVDMSSVDRGPDDMDE